VKRGDLPDYILAKIIDDEIKKYFDGGTTQDELIKTLNQKVILYLKE